MDLEIAQLSNLKGKVAVVTKTLISDRELSAKNALPGVLAAFGRGRPLARAAALVLRGAHGCSLGGLEKEEEGGYTVIVPALTGCVTFSKTVEESIAMVKEAIEGYMETLAYRVPHYSALCKCDIRMIFHRRPGSSFFNTSSTISQSTPK